GEYLMPYSDNYVWGPSFESDPLVIYDAYEGMRYGATLGGKAQARDGGEVTFAKLAGPDWLSVSSEGLLGGVPSNGDVGTNYFVVSAADSGGIPNDAELVITVLNTLTGELGNEDMVGFAGHWLDEGCVDIPLCGGADLTGDGSVDMNDYGAFASMWMIDYGYGGLVSHWPFDVDGSDQTGGNDATLINGAHVTTVGGEYKVGSGAMSFDGVDDYLRADSLCGAVAGMDISIAMWIKSDVTDANKFVCSFNTANGDGNRILIGQKASMADLAVYDNGWLSTGVTAFDGSWHHVVYMLCDSKNEGLVFIDGELEYVYSTTTSIEADDLLSFGQEYDAGMAVGDFFGGQIDDVRVYDRLIADGEIRELMGL
ncbi:MAG: hypothetical protein KAS23_08960, partial [Anaerohalosphaera sp.]|nr:hypothetical protein [Anaerohalosphaera sp.]